MRKRQLSLEALEKRLVLSGVGQGDTGQSGPDWQSVIVSFKDDVANPGAAASSLMQSAGGHVGHVYQHALKGFSAQMPAAAIDGLSHNPMVKTVEPDLVMTAFGDVPVPTGVDRIDAELNPTANIDGIDDRVDVNVAILDSGIGPHDDLNVVGGKHFYSITTGPRKGRGVFTDDNYGDDFGHGTHVAGTVGALDDGQGVVGVAPGARLWAVKVLDSNGVGNVSDIIRGIEWVTATHTDDDPTNDIEVANMSLGGQGVSDAYREAIQNSVAAGIVYVVAAGNEWRDIHGDDKIFGTADDTIPAAYPEVAAISAFADSDGMPGGAGASMEVQGFIYADDTYADFSNYSNSGGDANQAFLDSNPVSSPGLGIDLVMPGVDILSTSNDGGYALGSGTSMAAPHAAGLAALYIAEHGPAETAEEVYDIRQALIDSGKPWRSADGLVAPPVGQPNSDSPDGYEENLGWAGPAGPIDYPPTVGISSPTAGATVVGEIDIVALATDDVGVNQVEFQIDGATFFVDTNGTDGWAVLWDTSLATEGSHTITAIATDTADQQAFHEISVNVDNIDDAPTVLITNPSDGSTVSGSVDITANAADDNGVTQVEFFVGGASLGVDSDGSNGWSATWDTTGHDDGTIVTITATANDTIGQATPSDPISVTVNNAQAASEIYVADLAGEAIQGRRDKWQALVSVSIVDQDGFPVSGATVSGAWSGAATGTVTGLTGGDGSVTFASRSNLRGDSVTFAVTDVALEGFEYNASANLETSITVSSPYTTSTATDLDVLAGYLASTSANKKQSDKKDADDQTMAVDLLMEYGL
jgi:subtilisin